MTWEINFKDTIFSIRSKKPIRNNKGFNNIIHKTNKKINTIFINYTNQSKDNNLSEYFTTMTSDMMSLLAYLTKNGPLTIKKKCYNIGISKNHDYGSNNILRFGVLGIIVRLGDKLARLETLIESTNLVVDEKIEDTIEDAINYCVYGIMISIGIWN